MSTVYPATHSYRIIDEKSGSSVGQYRLEDSTSGSTQTHFIHVLQAKGATDPNVTISFTEAENSFIVRLEHATKGRASIDFWKGMSVLGGSFGYSSSGTPVLSALIDRVQSMRVTDEGPVWDHTLQNTILSANGTLFIGSINGDTATLFQLIGEERYLGTSYVVPSTVTRHWIGGLKPDTFHDVAIYRGDTHITINLLPADSGFKANEAGIIELFAIQEGSSMMAL